MAAGVKKGASQSSPPRHWQQNRAWGKGARPGTGAKRRVLVVWRRSKEWWGRRLSNSRRPGCGKDSGIHLKAKVLEKGPQEKVSGPGARTPAFKMWASCVFVGGSAGVLVVGGSVLVACLERCHQARFPNHHRDDEDPPVRPPGSSSGPRLQALGQQKGARGGRRQGLRARAALDSFLTCIGICLCFGRGQVVPRVELSVHPRSGGDAWPIISSHDSLCGAALAADEQRRLCATKHTLKGETKPWKSMKQRYARACWCAVPPPRRLD